MYRRIRFSAIVNFQKAPIADSKTIHTKGFYWSYLKKKTH